METASTQTLTQLLQRFLEQKFTGCITCADHVRTQQLWIVRGELVHAATNEGVIGWDAISGAKQVNQQILAVEADELPPQRSIRLGTARLLDALTHVPDNQAHDRMNVPLPFHERLQNKFKEVQKRVNGLKSFETHEEQANNEVAKPVEETDVEPARGAAPSERIIVEVTPRGAKWLHQSHGQELTISGDNNVTTSDLIWAGEELRREFNRLSKETPDNE